jgi:hypothetical protein
MYHVIASISVVEVRDWLRGRHDRQSITPDIRQVDISLRFVELHDPANLKAKPIEAIREMLLGLSRDPGRRSEIGTPLRQNGIQSH